MIQLTIGRFKVLTMSLTSKLKIIQHDGQKFLSSIASILCFIAFICFSVYVDILQRTVQSTELEHDFKITKKIILQSSREFIQ